MTKRAKVYRQGDVWIYRITRAEYEAQRSVTHVTGSPHPKGVILAEGEVTGHHHRIPEATRVALRPSRNGDGTVRLLEVKSGPVELVHEEHETITLPPGYYEVRIQREYAPTERKGETRVYD
jgi:hypothetical protein